MEEVEVVFNSLVVFNVITEVSKQQGLPDILENIVTGSKQCYSISVRNCILNYSSQELNSLKLFTNINMNEMNLQVESFYY